MNFIHKIKKFIFKIPMGILMLLYIPSICLAGISTFGIDWMLKIKTGEISDTVETLNNLLPQLCEWLTNPCPRAITIIIFVILTITIFYRAFYKPEAIIIRHSSFSNNLSGYDHELMKDYKKNEIEINLVDEMMVKHNIRQAVKKQDELIYDIENKCGKNKPLLYYGIAHIPLICRAGFQIGDEGDVKVLHKNRVCKNEFTTLTNDKYDDDLKYKNVQERSFSKELLVVVETSFKVTNNDIAVFQNKNMNEIYFYLDSPKKYNVDVIDSYQTQEKYRKMILDNIRKIVLKRGIQTIHLVLATSSDFAFYLAQGFSLYHDPDIIVYQYDKSSPVKYPWGISLKKKAEDSVIDQGNDIVDVQLD